LQLKAIGMPLQRLNRPQRINVQHASALNTNRLCNLIRQVGPVVAIVLA
jgi:hypothetical protein